MSLLAEFQHLQPGDVLAGIPYRHDAGPLGHANRGRTVIEAVKEPGVPASCQTISQAVSNEVADVLAEVTALGLVDVRVAPDEIGTSVEIDDTGLSTNSFTTMLSRSGRRIYVPKGVVPAPTLTDYSGPTYGSYGQATAQQVVADMPISPHYRSRETIRSVDVDGDKGPFIDPFAGLEKWDTRFYLPGDTIFLDLIDSYSRKFPDRLFNAHQLAVVGSGEDPIVLHGDFKVGAAIAETLSGVLAIHRYNDILATRRPVRRY